MGDVGSAAAGRTSDRDSEGGGEVGGGFLPEDLPGAGDGIEPDARGLPAAGGGAKQKPGGPWIAAGDFRRRGAGGIGTEAVVRTKRRVGDAAGEYVRHYRD